MDKNHKTKGERLALHGNGLAPFALTGDVGEPGVVGEMGDLGETGEAGYEPGGVFTIRRRSERPILAQAVRDWPIR